MPPYDLEYSSVVWNPHYGLFVKILYPEEIHVSLFLPKNARGMAYLRILNIGRHTFEKEHCEIDVG